MMWHLRAIVVSVWTRYRLRSGIRVHLPLTMQFFEKFVGKPSAVGLYGFIPLANGLQ
ncbi:MAG: hypothetical protein WA324_04440 [Bryobacteraceae bacterium]